MQLLQYNFLRWSIAFSVLCKWLEKEVTLETVRCTEETGTNIKQIVNCLYIYNTSQLSDNIYELLLSYCNWLLSKKKAKQETSRQIIATFITGINDTKGKYTLL